MHDQKKLKGAKLKRGDRRLSKGKRKIFKSKLLIVDDNITTLSYMKSALADEYRVSLATNGLEALATLKKERPPLVILDLTLPPHPQSPEGGFLTLADLIEEDPYVKVIIASSQADRQNALSAIEKGAYDFFCKPAQIEEVSAMLRRALSFHQMERENRALKTAHGIDLFDELIKPNPKLQMFFSTIENVLVTELPLLIRRALVLAKGSQITYEDLRLDTASPEFVGLTLKEAKERTERELISQVLKKNKFNFVQSAADLGISRTAIYDVMGRHGIKKEEKE